MNMVSYFSSWHSQCTGPRDSERFCWRFWLKTFELDMLNGREKRNMQTHRSQRQTRTWKKRVFVGCQGRVALLISPLFRAEYECCSGGVIYNTPASDPPLQHSSESEAQATHITYLYGPIWQHRTPHSHHILWPHNSVWVCVLALVKCNLSHKCTLSLKLTLYLYQLQKIWSSARFKMMLCF